MARYIDADKLLRNTIYNPSHVPYIAESDIIFAPTADVVERKKGKWVLKDGSPLDRDVKMLEEIYCSQCGGMACGIPFWKCYLEPTKYCPNCGAEMREETEDERSD